MSITYTDMELKIVSQLAYCNLDSRIYFDLRKENNDNTVTLQELFQKREQREKRQ